MNLALACSLCRTAGDKKKIMGITANISRTGALIRCLGANKGSDLPQEGDILIIDVALPENISLRRRCFHGRAGVVRVTASDAGELFLAVRFENLRFGVWSGIRVVQPEWADPVESVLM